MECPKCKRVGSVIKLTVSNHDSVGSGHRSRLMASLLTDYPGAVVRSRMCKACDYVWPTIEIWMEQQVPEEYAKDPMKMCDHSMQCMRTGRYSPTRRCVHKGRRCTKHRCKYCESLAEETASVGHKTDGAYL